MSVVKPKLNFGFAIYLVCIPLIVSIAALFKLNFAIVYQLAVWGIVYLLILLAVLVRHVLKGGKLNFAIIKNPFVVILITMFVWIVLSSIINNAFNIHFFNYLSYFMIFICVYQLNKNQRKIILNILIAVIAVCCIMGFVDPYGKFMPGFNSNSYNMSLQFINPNYIAYILAGLGVLTFVLFNISKGKEQYFYAICYLIFAVSIFINGTFVAISSLLLLEVVIQIVIGIKNKKFQHKLFVLFIILIPICFLVDLLPNITEIRTCRYNYFIECIAVFDNIFNTNILKLFNISSIAGADGWDRGALLESSKQHITSSPKTFLFGSGAGMFYIVRPHNGLMSLMVDFGVVALILLIALVIVGIKRIIKTKFNLFSFGLFVSLIAFLLCYTMGSFVCYSFYIMIIILALLVKDVKQI